MADNPMNIEGYSRYCAPTVLAHLLGCTTTEAAEMLTAEGANMGGGATEGFAWERVLEDLGGVPVDVKNPEGEEKYAAAVERAWAGRRHTWPQPSLKRYTVAGFCRRYPVGTFVVTTQSHTLMVKDGVVIADTMRTKSQRARVVRAHRFHNWSN